MELLKNKLADFKPILILVYLSATGFMGIMSVQNYLNLKIDTAICFCFMGLIFSIYTFNRFTDYAEDFANDIGKFIFFQKKGFFFVTAIVTVFATIGVLLAYEKLHWLHLLLLMTGFCYSYKIVPWYSQEKGLLLVRLKEIVFVKNLLVSFWWPVSLLCFPILFSANSSQNMYSIKWIGVSLFLLILNNTLFHDIMDEKGDKLAGINTLPTKWGSKKSFLLLWALDGAMFITTAVAYTFGKIDLKLFLFIVFLNFFPAIYKVLFVSNKTKRAVLEFICETDIIVFSVGLLLLRIVR